MAYKEVSRVDIAEVIRRWQKGNSQRHIASGVGLSRDTVRKYLGAAKEAGISREGPDPTEEQLSRLAALSRTGPRKAVAPLRVCWSLGVIRSTDGSPLTVCR